MYEYLYLYYVSQQKYHHLLFPKYFCATVQPTLSFLHGELVPSVDLNASTILCEKEQIYPF
jgi:hypothetical protein